MSSQTRVSLVVHAAQAGGEHAHSQFQQHLESENKAEPDEGIINPGDIVTEADRAAQRHVEDVIQEHYRHDVIVGEELDARKSVPEKSIAWVIDPIDGTYNFARGSRYWLTSVAVLRDGIPVAAANVAPALGEQYVANKGGSTRNGELISVTDHRDPRYANVAATVIPDYGARTRYAEGVAELFEGFGNARRYGTAQLTLSHVATGVLDGAVTPASVNPWDSIAGAYLVKQAGGQVTDLEGEPWRHDSQGLVASNGHIHDELLAVARTMAAE